MTDESQALADLSKPSLAALSQVLRNRELWPQGFEWDYTGCTMCAMGLACEMWFGGAENVSDWNERRWAIEQGISSFASSHIFYEVRPREGAKDVTPTDIADLIDAYLVEA